MKKNMPPQAQSDRLSAVEKDIALSIQDRRQMRDDIQEIKQSVKAFDEKFDMFVEKLDNKYATKWVETAVKWFFTTIMGVIIVAIVSSNMVK